MEPLHPTMILMEAVAQVGAIMVLARPENRDKLPFFMGITRARFRRPAYVGDAMEEPIDDLCAVAGELGLLGVKAFLFHEGSDPVAARAFQEIARLTRDARFAVYSLACVAERSQ